MELFILTQLIVGMEFIQYLLNLSIYFFWVKIDIFSFKNAFYFNITYLP